MQEQKEQERKARALQQWDDWALRSEMERPERSRVTKHFKVEVMVRDEEGNELAVSSLEGETEEDDSPQIAFSLRTNLVRAAQAHGTPVSEVTRPSLDEEGQQDADADAAASEAETIPVEARAPMVDEDLTMLDDVLTTTLCREWFDRWCANQIDDGLVVAKFGKKVLETFEINRAMIEMDEASQVDRNFLLANDPGGPEARKDQEQRGMKRPHGAQEGDGGGGIGSSSSSGGDSHAGMSDGNLGSRWRLTAKDEGDGEGVGWPGPEGDGKVRQEDCWPRGRHDGGSADGCGPAAGGPAAGGLP